MSDGAGVDIVVVLFFLLIFMLDVVVYEDVPSSVAVVFLSSDAVLFLCSSVDVCLKFN